MPKLRKIPIVSFLFIAFFVYNNLAIALPDVTYYTVNEQIPQIPVDTPLELPNTSGGIAGNVTVGSTDPATGAVIIQLVEDCVGNQLGNLMSSWSPLTAHYWQGGNVQPSGWGTQNTFNNVELGALQGHLDAVNSQGDFCYYRLSVVGPPCLYTLKCYTDGVNANYNDQFYNQAGVESAFTTVDLPDGLGTITSGFIAANPIDLYEYEEDVPQPPSCFDGIMNQDETDIDCGGVCVACPPPETCFDGIMNQDETGIDYGGVCGVGDPVAPPVDPADAVDQNNDGIDDITGLDSATGTVPVSYLQDATGNEYDTSMPGDISEVGDTNWSSLITGWIASNPLVMLAQNSTIELQSPDCVLTTSVFGTSFTIDFCSMTSMIDLIGTFVLGLMTVRSVFIAMGI